MPKSRGRASARHKPTRRRQPTSWESDVVRSCGPLLRPTATRGDAELYMSELLGAVSAGRETVNELDTVDHAVRHLTEYATLRGTAVAAVLVAALATVRDDDVVMQALDGWAREMVTDVAWTREPAPVLSGAWVYPDEYDDGRMWLLAYDDGVLSVHTDRAMDGAVTTAAFLVPHAAEEIAKEPPFGVPGEQLDPLAAASALIAAQDLTDRWWPPHDDEQYLELAALIRARLRATGATAAEEEWEPLPDDDRTALLDKFFADVDLPHDEVTRELADLCVTFADGWIRGGALMWSPDIVERFLLDWVPRKTVLDDERRKLVPSVTYAFVGWALIERGVDQELAAAAAAVALELADEFAQLYDETEKSPATELVTYLQDEGLDPTDPEQLEQGVARWNAMQNARRLLD